MLFFHLSSVNAQSISLKLNNMQDSLREAFKTADYPKCLHYCQNMILEGLLCENADTSAMLNQHLGSFYYNLACAQNLTGRQTDALISLGTAIKHGYRDYTNLKNDKDFASLQDNKDFKRIMHILEQYDYPTVLKNSAPYETLIDPTSFPKFTYASPTDSNLTKIRHILNLDSVAGNGDEISRIKNLTLFINKYIPHNGGNGNPEPKNGMNFINRCGNGKGTLNCRGLALLLNECFLAMGFPSRYITCFPQIMEEDCHVINAVYSRDLGKWIWMDPSFGAWVTDEQGNLLGLKEVRERLQHEKPVFVNDEINHNGDTITKEWYIDYYMTKNLYCMEAQLDNIYGAEDPAISSWKNKTFICLAPKGFMPNYSNGLIANDDKLFWAAPEP